MHSVSRGSEKRSDKGRGPKATHEVRQVLPARLDPQVAHRRILGLAMAFDAVEHGVEYLGRVGLVGGQHRPFLHVVEAAPRLVGPLANERAADNLVAVLQRDGKVLASVRARKCAHADDCMNPASGVAAIKRSQAFQRAMRRRSSRRVPRRSYTPANELRSMRLQKTVVQRSCRPDLRGGFGV